MMIANWFYLAGSLCFLIGTVLNMTMPAEVEEEEDDDEPQQWGFVVKDGGVVDGGEPDWEGWE